MTFELSNVLWPCIHFGFYLFANFSEWRGTFIQNRPLAEPASARVTGISIINVSMQC